MKVPWKSVFTVLKAVYVAFLKGKVVNLPGGIGPVTLPSQGNAPFPAKGSPFDSVPHAPGPPSIRPLVSSTWPVASIQDRRAPRPAPRADSLPEPVPPAPPLSTKTLGVILFVVFGLPIVGLTMLGYTEWRTLADDTPGNHVSATMRAAWNRAPGAVFLSTLVWGCFLTAVAWGLLAHAFFQ
jgi:hypothetical protein